MKKTYLFIFALSLWILPIWAWSWYGIVVIPFHVFLSMLQKRGKISAFVSMMPVVIISTLAVKALITSYFAVTTWIVWIVPVCYLAIILVLMVIKKS